MNVLYCITTGRQEASDGSAWEELKIHIHVFSIPFVR